jgi:hypothetical protein
LRRSARPRPPWRLKHADKARAQAEQEAIEGDQDPGQVIKASDVAEAAAVVPDRAQRSFTDPDARIRKTSDGSFQCCFNGQARITQVPKRMNLQVNELKRRPGNRYVRSSGHCRAGRSSGDSHSDAERTEVPSR